MDGVDITVFSNDLVICGLAGRASRSCFLDTLMKEMMVNWDMHMIIWTQEISAVWLIWFSVQHIPALQYSLYFLFRTY